MKSFKIKQGTNAFKITAHCNTVATPRSSTIYLASEGKEVIVDELGRQTVASVLLGSLDVEVDVLLCFEPLVTTENKT